MIGKAQREMSRYQWTRVTEGAAFPARDGAGALVYRGAMWLIGGWSKRDPAYYPRTCSNDVWRSQDGANWECVKPNTFRDASFDPAADWEGRHTAGYAVFGDKMWIIGGDANQRHYQDDVWCSADGIAWERVLDRAPWAPRVLHYTVAFNGRLWVMGGQTMPGFAGGEEAFYRDVWRSADGATWERVLDRAPWPPRGMIGGSAVFGGRIWLLGGGTYDTPARPERKFYNDVWSTADGVAWTCHTDAAPWKPRQYHEVAVYDDRLWVLEGYHRDGGNRKDVWHSGDGVRWTEVPDTPWPPRHAASVFVFRDALWMVAGNNMTSDVWRLTRRG